MAVEGVSGEPLSRPNSLFYAHSTGYSAIPRCLYASAGAFYDSFQPFRPFDYRIPNRLKQADNKHIEPVGALSKGIFRRPVYQPAKQANRRFDEAFAF